MKSKEIEVRKITSNSTGKIYFAVVRVLADSRVQILRLDENEPQLLYKDEKQAVACAEYIKTELRKGESK